MDDFEIDNLQGVTRDMLIVNMKNGSSACLYGKAVIDDEGYWYFSAEKDVIRYRSDDSKLFEDMEKYEKEKLIEKILEFKSEDAIKCEFK